MKRVLLTGGSGFLGSHVLRYFLDKTNWDIVLIDSFRHKGTYSRIESVLPNDRVEVLYHDLSIPVDKVLEHRIKPIDYIFNLASDSAVERSISNPVQCLRNNFEVGLNMLELARSIQPSLFIQFSTDEVFAEARNGPHKEWDAYLPSNAYAASKGSQDLMAIAYWRTYNLPIVITHCMNVIAQMQDTEKFLPKLIWKIATNQKMEIYADSDGNIGSRYYIHARSVADALVFIAKNAPTRYSDVNYLPDKYNIVGDIELNNLEVAQLVARYMHKELNYEVVNSDKFRPGYDKRYALNGDKLKGMGWTHPVNTKDSIKEIVEWTLKNPWWIGA